MTSPGEPAPRILQGMRWRSFTIPRRSLVWLAYLGILVFQPLFDPTADLLDWAVVALIVLAFLPVYGWTERHACDRPYFWRDQPGGLLGIGILLAMGVLLAPVNAGTSVFFIYAAASAGVLQPQRLALAVIALAFIGVPLAAALSALDFPWVLYPYLPALIFVPVVGLANYSQRLHQDANARLRMAQDEIEHLATVAERERIARDLHDLLGHTLSTITLKSELAARLMESDPTRAASEVRDVERISRDALGQVREAVRGYRSSGLDGELANAKLALEAAGLRFDYYFEPLDMAPIAESVLALALREGITNVVRHAGATRCQVRVETQGTRAVLTVTDDGASLDGELQGSAATPGSGLSGMRSRVEALGGSVSLRRQGKATVLEVQVPIERRGEGVVVNTPAESAAPA